MQNGARALLRRHNEMGRMSLAIDSSPLHARLRYRIPLHLLEEADVTRQARTDAQIPQHIAYLSCIVVLLPQYGLCGSIQEPTGRLSVVQLGISV